jgi:hypothetical protein
VALRAIDSVNFMAHRKMVDVSGDRRETVPREYVVLLPQARTMANALGVTISGLVIINADPDLLSYCRAAVPTGDGNFAMQATD